MEIYEVQQTFIASVVDTFSVISHRDMFVVGTRPLVDKRKKLNELRTCKLTSPPEDDNN